MFMTLQNFRVTCSNVNCGRVSVTGRPYFSVAQLAVFSHNKRDDLDSCSVPVTFGCSVWGVGPCFFFFFFFFFFVVVVVLLFFFFFCFFCCCFFFFFFLFFFNSV